MNLLEKLFYITDKLEYPNHWVGKNGENKHFDGSEKLIVSIVHAPDEELEISGEPTNDHKIDAGIVPEAFIGRAHECAEFTVAGGHKLLIVRFDKHEPYNAYQGENLTHFIEDVAVYWDRKKIGEMKIRDFWSYVTSAKEMKSGATSNEELWKTEVLPFYNQLKIVYEKWSAKLDADAKVRKKISPPDEI